MRAYIESVGVISRCAQSADDLTHILNGSGYEKAALPVEFYSQIPPAKMRRNSRYNRLACTAADNAVREAVVPEIPGRRRIGTIISTGYGSSVYYTQFADSVAKGVPGICSPAVYSGMVPNACVGQICILNGFKGVSTVLTGGDPLEYSSLLLTTNKADMILCRSVEEYNEALYSELVKLDALNCCELSEGAAMMMLTREKTDKTICKIISFSSATHGKSPLLHRLDDSAAGIVSGVLNRYGDAPDAVFTAANGTYFDDTESDAINRKFPEAVRIAPKKWEGETLGCGYMMNVAFAAAAINSGRYGKVLVTGVSGGIGTACARLFISEGAEVLGSYRTMRPELDTLGAKLFVLDTSDRENIAKTVKAEIRAFGGIDAVVNCIGITAPEPLFAASPDRWESVVETNLFSAMRIMQGAMVPLVKKGGAIVNISSVFGIRGGVGQSGYCASKGALDAMTRAAAIELAGKNIRVNAVAPGFVETEMTAGLDEKIREESLAKIPMKRFGKPDEIAELCAFLISDRAEYITGQSFVIDGGLSIY